MRTSKYGASLTQLKNEFNDIIGKLNPAYAKANKDFSDIARLKTAYEIGFDISKKTPAELGKFLNKFNKGEQEAFRVGIIAKVKDQAANAKDRTDFVNLIFGSPSNRDKLRLAFDPGEEGTKAFNKFKEVIELETGFARTRTKITQGSPTAERQVALREAGDSSDLVGLMSDLSTGGVSNVLRSGLANVRSRLTGLDSQSASQLARRLILQSPDEQIAFLNSLPEVERQLVQNSLNALKRQQSVAAIFGQQIANLQNQ
jgi:hypothetical protein